MHQNIIFYFIEIIIKYIFFIISIIFSYPIHSILLPKYYGKLFSELKNENIDKSKRLFV